LTGVPLIFGKVGTTPVKKLIPTTSPKPANDRVAARLSGEVMDLNEVCDFLRLSRSSVKRAIKAGEIPALKIGTQWRFRRTDILALWDKK